MSASWRPLYRAGAIAAFAAVIVFRPHLGAEAMLLRSLGLLAFDPVSGGPPEWFTLLQARPFLGLLLLDVFDLVNYALVGLVFLALFGALRGVRKSLILSAAGACFAGITVYFASNPAFAMLSLSRQ